MGIPFQSSGFSLDDVLKRINSLADDERKKLEKEALDATADMAWVPNPGPQTDAYFSQADETFYGGGAGGGKTALLCGTAVTAHHRSIIFRREYPQIKGLVDECAGILGSRAGYNSQDKVWKLPKDRELEFGAVQHEDDKEKYQGRAHDLCAFDEITHFTESQYRFLIGWNRSVKAGQRSRVIAAGNPPFTAEGAWVIKYWAPWLDKTHPNPAKPGELRWFTTISGEDVEVDGPGPYIINDRPVTARSRTFIPAQLEDNPDLMDTGYAAVIEAMPEPLRTMMRTGRFDVSQADDQFQVIPTAWVLAAQERWTANGGAAYAMTAVGVDVAQGGIDNTVLAPRYGGWYAPLIVEKGINTPDGSSVASLVVKHRRGNAAIIIDVGGGYGGSAMERMKDNGLSVSPYNGANASTAKTKDGQLNFVNKRAEVYWKFREELDPDQEGGSVVCLPPDAELRADLCAPRWKLTPRGIQIEEKADIKKRIGRSPDRGDAVVMALSEGNKAVAREVRRNRTANKQTTANRGYSAIKDKYRRH